MLQKFHKEKSDRIISIVGLGYVGLPVAVAFGKIGPVIGFDISERRIIELRNSNDTTCEVKVKELQNAQYALEDKVEGVVVGTELEKPFYAFLKQLKALLREKSKTPNIGKPRR